MSIGGRSLHKEDWLKLAGLAAIPVGGGMMGMGPLAGLLGSSAGAEAATALGIGLGAAPGEAAGAFTGVATAAPGGLLGGATKGLDALMKAQALMQLAAGKGQPTMAGASAPKRRKQSGSGLDYFEQIYPTG